MYNHIVIPNAHWSNRGDEAAHRALWRELRQLYPNSRLTIMFKDRKPVSWFPEDIEADHFPCQFKASSWDIWLAALTRGRLGRDPLLKKAVRTLASADLIVYPPGGAVISDRFFWSKQMEYLLPFLCARLHRIPIFVAAPSMGPFDANHPRPLRTWLLKTPRVLCVREPISARYLESIGVTRNVHVTLDLAFMSEVDRERQRALLDGEPALKDFLQAHDRVVGLTITDFKWHVKIGKNPELVKQVEESFRSFVRYLAGRGFGVLLIPQLFGNQNDSEYLKTFAEGPRTLVMTDARDCDFQQYIISRLYAVVGLRYHCNIFAAKMGTPFVAVAYEEKMSGFLDQAELSRFALSLDQTTPQSLVEKFAQLESEYSSFRLRLEAAHTQWRERAWATVGALSGVADL